MNEFLQDRVYKEHDYQIVSYFKEENVKEFKLCLPELNE